MEANKDALELLALWWKFESSYTGVTGYPTESPYCIGYRPSRMWDHENGADQTDGRGMLIRHVGKIIDDMHDPHRTALYVLAKNLVTGKYVWTSARLPANEDERIKITAEAVDMFYSRFGY